MPSLLRAVRFGSFAALALVMCVGCAARQTGAAGKDPDDPSLTDKQRQDARAQAYMAEVEKRANRRHVDVLWVRPPYSSSLEDVQNEEGMRQLMRNQPRVP